MDRTKVNAFEFVTLAGARAKQLLRGCTPRVEKSPGSEKLVRLAQKEIVEGKVEKVELPQ